ncbi:ankyrin repeat-containing domain protein, partial [Rhexocercosporidium sp. MPI-PUGE-AT-0058]
LIEYGADINATSADTQWTALHYACREGQLDITSFLIASGALINERDIEGNAPCLIAAKSKNWHIIQKFCMTSADLEARNLNEYNALHFAILHGSFATVEFLERQTPPEPVHFRRFCRPIHVAGYLGSESAIKFLKSNNLIPDINILTRGSEGYSPLHVAVLFNQSSTVKLLKDYGADLDLKSRPDEHTPLHLAAQHGYPAIVMALLEAGYSPNLTDAHGITPELLAIENDHTAVVKIISQHLDRLETKLEREESESSEPATTATGAKIWRLPLSKSPQAANVMKDGDMTIYAVRDGEGSEMIRKALGYHEGDNVICLRKPCKWRF